MEQQRVIFREIPLHVVARLVHPVTITKDCLINPIPNRRCNAVAETGPAPQQRDKDEIGAVMAIFDCRQCGHDHRISVRTALVNRQACQCAHCVSLGVISNFGQGLRNAGGQCRRCGALAVRVAKIDAEHTGHREVTDRQRYPEMAEIGWQIGRIAHRQTCLPRCQIPRYPNRGFD